MVPVECKDLIELPSRRDTLWVRLPCYTNRWTDSPIGDSKRGLQLDRWVYSALMHLKRMLQTIPDMLIHASADVESYIENCWRSFANSPRSFGRFNSVSDSGFQRDVWCGVTAGLTKPGRVTQEKVSVVAVPFSFTRTRTCRIRCLIRKYGKRHFLQSIRRQATVKRAGRYVPIIIRTARTSELPNVFEKLQGTVLSRYEIAAKSDGSEP